MKYIIVMVIAFISAIVSYTTLDKKIANKLKIYHILKSQEEDNYCSTTQIYILLMVIFLLNLLASMMILKNVDNNINIIKMLITLICITGAATNDYREKRIPNIFPISLAIIGIVCLIIGCISKQQGATSYLISSLFATIMVAICMTIAYILTKQGIGLGDIKLLCALALIGGVYTVGGTIFFGMIICTLISIGLLITKRKTMKDGIPFGPFIYLGYLITIYTSMY